MALNRKCVEIGLGFFGASNSGIDFSPTEIDHNCAKRITIGAGCLVCNKGYDLDIRTKRCVVSCTIYSEKLDKCLDNADESVFTELKEENQNMEEVAASDMVSRQEKLHSLYDEEAFDLLTYAQRDIVFELAAEAEDSEEKT